MKLNIDHGEHPVSMEFGEDSCDLLTPDVTEESIPAVPNGVIPKQKGQKSESLSTVDENVSDSSNNDLSINSRIIDKVMETEDANSVEVESTSCDPVNGSCSETISLEKSDNNTDKTDTCGIENHISYSSAKVNGFSSKRSTDDDTSKDEIDFKDLTKPKSPLRMFFGSDSLNDIPQSICETTDESSMSQKSVSEETEKSSTDLPIVDSCDKSINNATNECRVNGDILKSPDDRCMSPAPLKRKLDADSDDSDSESGHSSSCPEKRAKITNCENSSSCSEKRSEIEDSVVPNGYSDCENSVDSVATNSFQQKKKTTARKSTGGAVHKTVTHLVEEECAEEPLADAEKLVMPVENGVGHSTTDFVDVDASSNEGRQSPVDDRKYPIKFTRESMSDESLKNVFRKMVKGLSRRQLEEMMIQKCCEMISENSEIGELKKQSSEIEETEVFRKNKIISIEKQMHQLRMASDIFCTQARLSKEGGQIITPKVFMRSVGIQVSLSPTSETNSPSTRANSVDEDDQKAASAVMNSRVSSSDAGQSPSCSSSTKSPRPSSSETAINERNQKPSLPTGNSSAASSKSNSVLPAKRSSSSETPAKPPAPSDDAIVDLTELDDNADSPPRPTSVALRNGLTISRLRHPSELPVPARHPAPLPPTPKSRNVLGAKLPPPKPNLFIQKCNLAIQITWDLLLTDDYEPIEKYQIYAYQETAGVPATVALWKLVGDVESLELPMACTLTQFVNGYTYHFAVRAVDKHGRHGAFSSARSIAL